MKLRSTFPILLSFLIITSCRNEEQKEDDIISPETENTFETNDPSGNERISSPASSAGSSQSVEKAEEPGSGANDVNSSNLETSARAISEGKYIKEGETDPSCACYCIDINFSANNELCLQDETIYINSRMSRGKDGLMNIYLMEAASRNTEGDDIPWDDFDKNTPIATITPIANGQIELDWLGFTINGDLAMDYAIYGKKTLEGIYKKK